MDSRSDLSATAQYLKRLDVEAKKEEVVKEDKTKEIKLKNEWSHSEIKSCKKADEIELDPFFHKERKKSGLAHNFYPDRLETTFKGGGYGYVQLRKLNEWEFANQYQGALLLDCDDTMIRGKFSLTCRTPIFIYQQELQNIIRFAHQNRYFIAIVTARTYEEISYSYDPLSVAMCLRQLDPQMRVSHIFFTNGLLKSSVCQLINEKFSIPFCKMTIVDDLQSVMTDCGKLGVNTIVATSYGGHFFHLKKMFGLDVTMREKLNNFLGRSIFFRKLLLEEDEASYIVMDLPRP